MTNTKKRTFSFLMLLCLTAVFLCNSPRNASAQKNPDKTVYAAFGDSIAAGYGLDGYSSDQTTAPGGSYQTLLADFLHTQSCNYAVSGNDSSDCISLLESGSADADLKNADIITLSIGSNDLLLPFIQIVMDYFQIEPGSLDPAAIEEQLKNGFTFPQPDMSEMMEYYQQLEQLLAILSDNEVLNAQAAAFPEKLETILSMLHKKAPGADIYVTNIYNPFSSIPRIGDLAEIYISKINQAFTADSPDYTLIDVHTPFQQEELTNVQIDLSSLSGMIPDPHPSKKGHKVIGNLLITAVKQKNAPKAAAITSISSSSKKKLSIKAKLPAGADGYQIRYASSKNGTYQTLASSSGKTYQTNSGRLKSGKTYYVKLRSFRSVKGVTYYGKNSAVKKVTVK